MNYGNYIKKVCSKSPFYAGADIAEHGRAMPNWRRWETGR
jgi:hypothetical protein